VPYRVPGPFLRCGGYESRQASTDRDRPGPRRAAPDRGPVRCDPERGSPVMIADRRRFLKATASAFGALAASGCMRAGLPPAHAATAYGPLMSDPDGLLDLPRGFNYRVLARLGDRMDDGGTVPDAADGMGCFDLGGGKVALVRNHELSPGQGAVHELTDGYRRDEQGRVLPGGTTTLVLDAASLRVERQFRSLAGTMRNC